MTKTKKRLTSENVLLQLKKQLVPGWGLILQIVLIILKVSCEGDHKKIGIAEHVEILLEDFLILAILSH